MIKKVCYLYGIVGHLSHVCRISKHLVDLYQASLEKKKRKNVVYNWDYQDNGILFEPSNLTHLDVANFFETLEEKINTIY